MKRFTALLVLILMLVMLTGILTAFAGSASATISGPDSVAAGGTYTYTYTLSVSAACAANLTVSVGGAFEMVSGGDGLFHDSIPDNTSASYSDSVTVRVKDNAATGDKGTISVSGGYAYLDEAYKDYSGTVSKSLSATVAAAATTPAPSDAATPAPSATKTPKPAATSAVTPAVTPVVTPSQGGWNQALVDVSAMAEGGTVTVSLPESALLPAELLAALKAKGGRLVVDFGSYSCIIDGQMLGGTTDGPLDIAMSMEKDAALSAVADGGDVFQLHFAHEGELPGPVTVSFDAEGYSPGDILYLYYYYASSGAAEFRQSAEVGEDGRVSFVLYHCSAYYVTAGAAGSAEEVIAPVTAQTQAAAPEASANGGVAAAVSDANGGSGGYSLTALLLAAGVALIVGGGAVFLATRLLAVRKKARPITGKSDMDL